MKEKEDKIPVEDIMWILDYLHDEQKDYETCDDEDKETDHVYAHMEKVDMWLARNYHEERGLALDKINARIKAILKQAKLLNR